MKPRFLVVSSSLHPGSRSRVLATTVQEMLQRQNVPVDFVDLRDWPLPLCDGESAYGDPRVGELTKKVRAADCIIIGVPIYNYDVSASAKNLVEMVGGALENKVIGFLCAAGGDSSYMSVMSFASSLMLDFRCFILPRFVYATGEAFGPSGVRDAEIRSRLEQLAREALRVTTALAGADGKDLRWVSDSAPVELAAP